MNHDSAPRLTGYSLILSILAAFLIGLFLWSINKGFDLTDEGFYLMGYTYPEEYSSSFTNFHLLINKLLDPAHTSIIGYRLASLFTTVVSGLLLAGGLWVWIKEKYQATPLPFWLLAALFISGNFLQYSIFPRTIFYNNINAFCMAFFASSILVYSAYPSANGFKRRHFYLFVGAFFIGLDLFVKGSSSVGALVTGGLALVLCVGLSNIREWYKPVGIVGLGYFTGLLLFFTAVQSFGVWRTNFVHETQLLLQTSYNGGLLVRYLKDAYPLLRTLIYPFSVFILASFFLTRAYLRQKLRLATSLQIGIIVLGGVFLGFEALRTGLYKNTHLNYNRSAVWFLALLFSVVAMFAAAYLEQPYRKLKWRKIVVVFWLLLMPFVGAVGTYNNLFINFMLEINYWLAVLCILYVSMPNVAALPLVRIVIFLVPIFIVTQQYTYGMLLAPYVQAANMLQQSEPVTFGKTHTPAELLVDPKTAHYMEELRTTLKKSGFEPGMPIVAVYDLPGLVYALDGISPGNPWMFGQLDLRNCDALNKTRLDLTSAFVLVNEKPGAELVTCMRSHGMLFPEGYTEVRRLLSPYNPNQYSWRNYQDTLIVYAPKKMLTAH
ncbi:hypothetical protein [Hymenobacter metallicola]|uniref:Glycosyltransferase RgtA/B/C/D-like domain-containing protein n=1 Tax=Hymenobacter metallicola TaxID=2563114 RepID=A0A4Z0PZN6_9BACT|nr:hypothetical protein [Hymenobacter metallicola]TGE23238.1 hypothetical protein E5K02_18730 [Hymenobacter metallicola]